MFDMTKCKPGTRVVLRNGEAATCGEPIDYYPILYNVIYDDGLWGYVTADGAMFPAPGTERDDNLDVVGLADNQAVVRGNPSRHGAILDRLAETYASKNADYGDSFTKGVERYGYVSAMTRIFDKVERLDQLLVRGAKPNHEAAVDSAMDLANYAIMLAMALGDE